MKPKNLLTEQMIQALKLRLTRATSVSQIAIETLKDTEEISQCPGRISLDKSHDPYFN